MLNGSINIKINFKWYAFSKMCMQMCVTIFLFFVIVIGRKGGHKGRMRTYTSPEEIDAQMKAEKERKKVGKGIGDKGQLCFCNFLTMYYVSNYLKLYNFWFYHWEVRDGKMDSRMTHFWSPYFWFDYNVLFCVFWCLAFCFVAGAGGWGGGRRGHNSERHGWSKTATNYNIGIGW